MKTAVPAHTERETPRWMDAVLSSRLTPLVFIALIVALRLVALGSDSYTRLDWSAAQLTDEGFYIHNARNVALFGHARTDGFNNMLVSPLLHYLQVAVFTTFGVGAVQARMISVVCSLLTLALFWAAMRRAFDNRIAALATLFLGLDHTNLLFNRMALMDTPAALPAVAAFYAFVRAMQADSDRGRQGWLATCGFALGVTLVMRTLCAFLLPAPFAALAYGGRLRERGRDFAALAAGLVGVLAVYGALWYWPHRAELGAMNHYYRVEQVQPHSLRHLAQNLQHAVVGDFRGEAPYLFRHTPVVFALALLAVGCWTFGLALRGQRREGQTADTPPGVSGPATLYLFWWLLLGWAMLAAISYSPARYYVTTYPALAGIAAIALARLPALWRALWTPGWQARLLRGALAWFLAYHAVQTLLHHGGVLPRVPTLALLYGMPGILALIAAAWRREGKLRPAWLVPTALVLWAAGNAYWLGDWAYRLRYSQRDASLWLARNLPSGSVLIGDIAPGLCLDNRFVAVNVIWKLCNGDHPVEQFAGRPRYIVILDGRWKEGPWIQRYPELVARNRRLRYMHVLRWPVGIYPVDDALLPATNNRQTWSNHAERP